MTRIHILLLLLGAFISLTAAASAPTFCKCTCFKNSTIIALGPEHQQDTTATDKTPYHKQLFQSRSASTSCSECTKKFCLSQGISFCKDAEEDDVVTLCFQRDSNKDKIIVWGFIVGTLGLLGWAVFKRVLEWREARGIGGGFGGGGGGGVNFSRVPRS